MHSVRALLRGRGAGSAFARCAFGASVARATGTKAAAAMAFVRHSSSTIVVPENMRPSDEEVGHDPVTTMAGKLDPSSPPERVRAELWSLFIATLLRVDKDAASPPRRRVLHWILLNAETKEELDMALTLTLHWRKNTFPITQATTHIWAQACVRTNYPDIFVTMLMDRWKYRQLPVVQTIAYFIRFLGGEAASAYAKSTESGDDMAIRGDQLLDDIFRVFALLPYYDVAQGASAYGALVEACCEINTEEAWRRALVASEEVLSCDPPQITLEALKALENRSRERGETEMADRYQSLATRADIKPTRKSEATFDKKGNLVPDKE